MRIEVKNLSKKFKDNLAVKNISFIIEKNKTIGLLGPNGCGKTTTIGMMLGLILPTEGEVLINGENINKINMSELLGKINFASPYIELPKKLTVKQNLEVYARLYGVEKIETRNIATEEELLTISLEECLELLAQPKKFGRRAAKPPLKELGLDPVSEKPILLKEGQWGPYVTDGKTNASLQLGDSVEEITDERAVELLAERRAKV